DAREEVPRGRGVRDLDGVRLRVRAGRDAVDEERAPTAARVGLPPAPDVAARVDRAERPTIVVLPVRRERCDARQIRRAGSCLHFGGDERRGRPGERAVANLTVRRATGGGFGPAPDGATAAKGAREGGRMRHRDDLVQVASSGDGYGRPGGRSRVAVG